MRPIHLVTLDKIRPAVVVTREVARPHLAWVTVVPITSRIRGLTTEVRVGTENGLDQDSVLNCDNLTTIPVTRLGQQIGFLLDRQEAALVTAIHAAFDLDD